MTTVASIETVEAGTMKKIHWRILPLVFVIYLVAFLDRANVAYAKLTMSADLGFSEAVYGFGAGVFFAGYLLLEIPGALIVQKWGGAAVVRPDSRQLGIVRRAGRSGTNPNAVLCYPLFPG